MVKCPKCDGSMVVVPADVRAPAHDSCLMCGFYREHAIVPVMPDIPPVPAVTHNMYQMTIEERREYNREAGRRFRERKGPEEMKARSKEYKRIWREKHLCASV